MKTTVIAAVRVAASVALLPAQAPIPMSTIGTSETWRSLA